MVNKINVSIKGSKKINIDGRNTKPVNVASQGTKVEIKIPKNLSEFVNDVNFVTEDKVCDIIKNNPQKLNHSLIIGEHVFDGTQDVVVHVYDGGLNTGDDNTFISCFSSVNQMTMINTENEMSMINTENEMTMINTENEMSMVNSANQMTMIN